MLRGSSLDLRSGAEVYRLEDSYGWGPYRPGFEAYDVHLRAHGLWDPESMERWPNWQNDGLGDVTKWISKFMGECGLPTDSTDWRSGFETEESLYSWFGTRSDDPDLWEVLDRTGYSVVKRQALPGSVLRGESGRQVVFLPMEVAGRELPDRDSVDRKLAELRLEYGR